MASIVTAIPLLLRFSEIRIMLRSESRQHMNGGPALPLHRSSVEAHSSSMEPSQPVRGTEVVGAPWTLIAAMMTPTNPRRKATTTVASRVALTAVCGCVEALALSAAAARHCALAEDGLYLTLPSSAIYCPGPAASSPLKHNSRRCTE
jgi:hypothetical protein